MTNKMKEEIYKHLMNSKMIQINNYLSSNKFKQLREMKKKMQDMKIL
jgi:hypothetical protein